MVVGLNQRESPREMSRGFFRAEVEEGEKRKEGCAEASRHIYLARGTGGEERLRLWGYGLWDYGMYKWVWGTIRVGRTNVYYPRTLWPGRTGEVGGWRVRYTRRIAYPVVTRLDCERRALQVPNEDFFP